MSTPVRSRRWRTRARRAPLRLLLLSLVLCQVVTHTFWPLAARVAVAADLFEQLRSFPGVVLVPAAEMAPFTTLEPWRYELNRPRAGSTVAIQGRYLIQYRDVAGGDGSAQLGGATGRDEFDDTLTMLAEHSFQRCPAEAAYCAENVAGQDGAMPASELFRGLAVGDNPAVVEHVVCCGGHYWSLSWYDLTRDMTYSFVLVGPLADEYGTTITAENEYAAQTIAEVAGRLQPLE